MPGARKETTPILIDNPVYTGRAAVMGELTVVFESLHRGGDAADVFKGLPDDRCPCPHWGLVTKGRLTLRYRDFEETFEAGEIYYAPPGHLPLAEPGTELITLSPSAELEKVNAVIAKNQELIAKELLGRARI